MDTELWGRLFKFCEPLEISHNQTIELAISAIHHRRSVTGNNGSYQRGFSKSKMLKALSLGITDDQLPISHVFTPYAFGPYSWAASQDLTNLEDRGYLETYEVPYDNENKEPVIMHRISTEAYEKFTRGVFL